MYVDPLNVRVAIAPALEVIIGTGAESTYTPWPVVPRKDNVVVVPPNGDVNFAYNVFIPETVGVAVKVTTPVAELYAVTVQFEMTVLDVFK